MPTASKTAKPAPSKKPAPASPVAKRAEAAEHDIKVVRDGFTMPKSDYDLLKTLKATCLERGVEVKKSELLRAGVQALSQMPAKALFDRINALPPVKAGRKKKKD